MEPTLGLHLCCADKTTWNVARGGSPRIARRAIPVADRRVSRCEYPPLADAGRLAPRYIIRHMYQVRGRGRIHAWHKPNMLQRGQVSSILR
jgi:hypothetical protein